VSLYESLMRSGSQVPPIHLLEYFERTLLDHPWADPAIPSLIFVDADGEILGFIGSHVRRFRFDGQPIRIAWTGPLMTHPSARRTAIGAFLLRRYLQGPQHATLTDGANEASRRLMQAMGGEVSHLRSLRWVRVLRPASFGAAWLSQRAGRRIAAPLRPISGWFDSFAGARTGLRPKEAGGHGERLSPEAMTSSLPSIARSLRCFPDYDNEMARWLFHEVGEVRSRGSLMASLVRDPRDAVLGWYLCQVEEGGDCSVLQVAAKTSAAGEVLDRLFHEAYGRGAVTVRGRLEPTLLEPLATRSAVFRYWGATLIHSQSSDLMGVLLSSRCLLTNLDGESWMGHNVEPFA
jgi:Acetyltransferase (GNAT) family